MAGVTHVKPREVRHVQCHARGVLLFNEKNTTSILIRGQYVYKTWASNPPGLATQGTTQSLAHA